MEHPCQDGTAATTLDDHVLFDDVTMKFRGQVVLGGLTCGFPRGKITVILGSSGAGKSTMLRLMGRLIQPTSGRILVDGEDIVSMSTAEISRVRLKIGMMFQGGALLDSTTVFDNIAFPLREHRKLRLAEIKYEVEETLKNVGLDRSDSRRLPSELSGGMLKRVALARSIIMKPVIVLCDEPLSGLDPITSKRIELLLQRICREHGMTLIVVSHDSASTMRIADHVVIMLPGQVVAGDPKQLLECGDQRVVNLLSGVVDDSLIQAEDGAKTSANSQFDLTSTWY
jgi:phospholipid/cholesterol/gamma-HCH transport system ATP-binding protein